MLKNIFMQYIGNFKIIIQMKLEPKNSQTIYQ